MMKKLQQIIIILGLSFCIINSEVYADNITEKQATDMENKSTGEDEFNAISSDSAKASQDWYGNNIGQMWSDLKAGYTLERLYKPVDSLIGYAYTLGYASGLVAPASKPSAAPSTPGANTTATGLMPVVDPKLGPSPSLPNPGIKPSSNRVPEPKIEFSTVSVVGAGEVKKFSNKEFENAYIKPSFSRSRNSLKDIEFARNTNLKLHSLFLSNSALGR